MRQIKPDFEEFVLPVKKYADIIIPNFGGDFLMKNYPNVEESVQDDDDGFSKFDTGIIDMLIEKIGKKVQTYWLFFGIKCTARWDNQF